MALLRFFRNGVIVGTVDNEDEVPVLELAEDGGGDFRLVKSLESGEGGGMNGGGLSLPDNF